MAPARRTTPTPTTSPASAPNHCRITSAGASPEPASSTTAAAPAAPAPRSPARRSPTPEPLAGSAMSAARYRRPSWTTTSSTGTPADSAARWLAGCPTGRCRRPGRPGPRWWWCGWRPWSTRTGVNRVSLWPTATASRSHAQLPGCDLGQRGAAALTHLGAAHQQGDRPVGVHSHLGGGVGRGAGVAGGDGHGPAPQQAGSRLGRVLLQGGGHRVEVGDQVGVEGAFAVDDGVAGGQQVAATQLDRVDPQPVGGHVHVQLSRPARPGARRSPGTTTPARCWCRRRRPSLAGWASGRDRSCG